MSMSSLKRISRKRFLYLPAIIWVTLLASNIWIIQYIQAESTLYFWDQLSFWRVSFELSTLIRTAFVDAVTTVLTSIRNEDYNLLSAIPASLGLASFGNSRTVFILSNANLLLFPALATLATAPILAIRDQKDSVVSLIFGGSAIILAPLPWVVTLHGYPDAGGLFLLAWATLIAATTPLESSHLARWAIIGILLGLLGLFRRWYLYPVVGFSLVVALEYSINMLRSRRQIAANKSNRTTQYLRSLAAPIVAAITLAATYFIISWPLPARILGSDFSSMYSAYRNADGWFGSLYSGLKGIIAQYGPGQFAASFSASIIGISIRPLRRCMIYLVAPTTVAFLLFSRTQTIGMSFHHTLLLYIPLILPPIILCQYLISTDRPPLRHIGICALLAVSLYSAGNFLTVFSKTPPQRFAAISDRPFATMRVRPFIRSDIAEFEAMLNLVNQVCTRPEHQVYVLASSGTLNATHLQYAEYSLGKSIPATSRILRTRDVDRRDGAPVELIQAHLVFVAVPVQTHLNPQEQQSIVAPANMFIESDSFSHAFTRLPQEFTLENGVRVLAFRRTRPTSNAETEALLQSIPLAH